MNKLHLQNETSQLNSVVKQKYWAIICSLNLKVTNKTEQNKTSGKY